MVFHRCVEDLAGLQALKGSKYIRSELGNTYRRIRAMLRKGREVLFIGTPCQVAGLYAYLGNDYEKLTTVDLVCHGAPDGKFFQEYLAELEKVWLYSRPHYLPWGAWILFDLISGRGTILPSG